MSEKSNMSESNTLDAYEVERVLALAPEQRLDYLLKKARENQQIWILADDYGCVMFNTEEEDCVPVWPSEEFAKLWCTDEWAECKPMALTIEKWTKDWTSGLEDDEVNVVVFPNLNSEGLIYPPWEFEEKLKKS